MLVEKITKYKLNREEIESILNKEYTLDFGEFFVKTGDSKVKEELLTLENKKIIAKNLDINLDADNVVFYFNILADSYLFRSDINYSLTIKVIDSTYSNQ